MAWHPFSHVTTIGREVIAVQLSTRRLVCIAAVAALLLSLACATPAPELRGPGEEFPLPDPALSGTLSVEKALAHRRSVRTYSPVPLTLDQLGQLLWAAQGITDYTQGLRSTPSAGATYPLEVLVSVGRVDDLSPGLYRYQPGAHSLILWRDEDVRQELAQAALGQTWIAQAPAVVVLAAEYERTTARYGERGERYVHMEIGHAGQNVYLQAEALGLATVMVGAFEDEVLQELLGIDEPPLAILPVGVRGG